MFLIHFVFDSQENGSNGVRSVCQPLVDRGESGQTQKVQDAPGKDLPQDHRQSKGHPFTK